MSTTTSGVATTSHPGHDTSLPGFASTAERRAGTLAPTVYCPSLEIEECIERSRARGVS